MIDVTDSKHIDGAALAASDVSYAVGMAQLLDAVSLEVRGGSLLGLIGPNGAGKSTLLKCISQLLAPSTGQVSLDGEDLRGRSPQEIARHIALLPQSTTLNFAFTCLEVVLMGRNPHLGRFEAEGARDHAIAQQSMANTDSEEFVTRLITEVSAGERQRVLLARALTQQPRLLLLDEPTAGPRRATPTPGIHTHSRPCKPRGLRPLPSCTTSTLPPAIATGWCCSTAAPCGHAGA